MTFFGSKLELDAAPIKIDFKKIKYSKNSKKLCRLAKLVHKRDFEVTKIANCNLYVRLSTAAAGKSN